MMRRQLGRHTGTHTGEVGKIVPVSNARIASVEAIAAGGFKVGLKGAAGEVVAMGGAKVDGAGQPQPPVYGTVTIGPDDRRSTCRRALSPHRRPRLI